MPVVLRYRPRVEVFCFRGSRVLAGYKSYVVFPGGGIDPKENAVEAAKREFAEEASRRLINCSVAHPPSTQEWPEGYANRSKWSRSYDGGQTFWMTGSCGEILPELKHKDFEKSLDWHPIDEVVGKLEASMGKGWDDDVRVRIAVLEAQRAMHHHRTPDRKVAGFPVLHAAGAALHAPSLSFIGR